MAVFVNAQEINQNAVLNTGATAIGPLQHPSLNNHVGAGDMTPVRQGIRHSGAKTTSTGGGRWYSYDFEYFDLYQLSLSQDINFISQSIWNDTTALFGYTGTFTYPYYPYEFNSVMSTGLGFDPLWSYWNGTGSGSTSSLPLDYTGLIGVSSADAYTIDSVDVVGWYTRSSLGGTKLSVVDTLIFTFVAGQWRHLKFTRCDCYRNCWPILLHLVLGLKRC